MKSHGSHVIVVTSDVSGDFSELRGLSSYPHDMNLIHLPQKQPHLSYVADAIDLLCNSKSLN